MYFGKLSSSEFHDSNMFFQIYKTGAPTTIIGATEPHMGDYTNFHPNFVHIHSILALFINFL
jgi:hypothetical protein